MCFHSHGSEPTMPVAAFRAMTHCYRARYGDYGHEVRTSIATADSEICALAQDGLGDPPSVSSEQAVPKVVPCMAKRRCAPGPDSIPCASPRLLGERCVVHGGFSDFWVQGYRDSGHAQSLEE